MAIVHSNWLFIASPRTGTTSIQAALRQFGDHAYLPHHVKLKDAQNYPKRPLQGFDERFTFAFIRDPRDWLVSWYTKHPQYDRYMEPVSFADFAMGHTERDSQHHFWAIDGKIAVDYLGKFEKIDEEFQIICKLLGVKAELPHRNASKRKHWQEYYTPEIEDHVRKTFKTDFKLGGY